MNVGSSIQIQYVLRATSVWRQKRVATLYSKKTKNRQDFAKPGCPGKIWPKIFVLFLSFSFAYLKCDIDNARDAHAVKRKNSLSSHMNDL